MSVFIIYKTYLLLFKILFSGKGEEKLFKNIQNQQSNKHNLKPDILHDQINHNVQYNNGKANIIKLVIKTIMSKHVLQQ